MIYDKKVTGTETVYLVRFEGWSLNWNAWIPSHDIGDSRDLVRDYEISISDRAVTRNYISSIINNK